MSEALKKIIADLLDEAARSAECTFNQTLQSSGSITSIQEAHRECIAAYVAREEFRLLRLGQKGEQFGLTEEN